MTTENIILQLQQELEKTNKELNDTKEHLKKYTAPVYKKQYYENNKEEIIKKKKRIPTDRRTKKEMGENR